MHSLSNPYLFFIIPALLLVIVFIDLKTLKIPNFFIWITLSAGILTSIISFGLFSGLVFAAAGMATEFLIFFILYLVGPMGAGDVKLAAALGTFLGPQNALLASLICFITGGLFSLIYLLFLLCARKKNLARRKLPFSPAIACGTLLAIWPPNFILPIKHALEQ